MVFVRKVVKVEYGCYFSGFGTWVKSEKETFNISIIYSAALEMAA